MGGNVVTAGPAKPAKVSGVPASTETHLSNPALAAFLPHDLTYAPGVDPANPETWITESHYRPQDYARGEGLPDWQRAETHPNEVQQIRAYLVLPTPDQQRTRTDYDSMGRMIADVAARGLDQPIEVRRGDGDYVLSSSGHRRRFAGVNAGEKFLPCLLKPGTEDPLLAHERMILGNAFRLDVDPVDKALYFVKYLDLLKERVGQELSVEDAVAILAQKFDVSEGDAAKYLAVTQIHPRVRKLVNRKMLTLDEGAAFSRFPYDEQPAMLEKFLHHQFTPDDIPKLGKAKGGHSDSRARRPLAVKESYAVNLPDLADPVTIRIECKSDATPEQIEHALKTVRQQLGFPV